MNFDESIRIGLAGLLAHRVRSVLTALGIIFGVAAVIAMLSIGEGARLEALEQIRLMGVNNIIIKTKELSAQTEERAKANFSPGLTALDGEAIHQVCPGIDYVIPHWEKSTFAQFLSEREEIKLIGTTPEFLAGFGYTISFGRFFTAEQMREQANVCVIGVDVKDALFAFETPIGKSIKVDDQWFSVIGVMTRQLAPSKKVESLDIRNLNIDVYIPLTTAQYKMVRYRSSGTGSVTFRGGGVSFSNRDRTPRPKMELDQMTVKLDPNARIEEVAEVVKRILARRHYGISDYEVVVPEALVQQSQKTQQIFNVVMGAIAGISLLVGGIGIMNIMLASVLERTKEIGIRRAVGATRGDVLTQFLFEALFISVVGGIIGIFIGWALTSIITLYAGWRTVVSVAAVILAFTVSAAVGVAFGYYPAKKAASQNPIESLRYE
ncbi:MAG: ABC transporter permease [Ignavibacteriae bacterium]|nr:ABC transporter permease [Ignavibacteriota bacterium]